MPHHLAMNHNHCHQPQQQDAEANAVAAVTPSETTTTTSVGNEQAQSQQQQPQVHQGLLYSHHSNSNNQINSFSAYRPFQRVVSSSSSSSLAAASASFSSFSPTKFRDTKIQTSFSSTFSSSSSSSFLKPSQLSTPTTAGTTASPLSSTASKTTRLSPSCCLDDDDGDGDDEDEVDEAASSSSSSPLLVLDDSNVDLSSSSDNSFLCVGALADRHNEDDSDGLHDGMVLSSASTEPLSIANSFPAIEFSAEHSMDDPQELACSPHEAPNGSSSALLSVVAPALAAPAAMTWKPRQTATAPTASVLAAPHCLLHISTSLPSPCSNETNNHSSRESLSLAATTTPASTAIGTTTTMIRIPLPSPSRRRLDPRYAARLGPMLFCTARQQQHQQQPQQHDPLHATRMWVQSSGVGLNHALQVPAFWSINNNNNSLDDSGADSTTLPSPPGIMRDHQGASSIFRPNILTTSSRDNSSDAVLAQDKIPLMDQVDHEEVTKNGSDDDSKIVKPTKLDIDLEPVHEDDRTGHDHDDRDEDDCSPTKAVDTSFESIGTVSTTLSSSTTASWSWGDGCVTPGRRRPGLVSLCGGGGGGMGSPWTAGASSPMSSSATTTASSLSSLSSSSFPWSNSSVLRRQSQLLSYDAGSSDRFIPSRATSNLNFHRSLWDVEQRTASRRVMESTLASPTAALSSTSTLIVGSAPTATTNSNAEPDRNEGGGMMEAGATASGLPAGSSTSAAGTNQASSNSGQQQQLNMLNTLLRSELLGENEIPYVSSYSTTRNQGSSQASRNGTSSGGGSAGNVSASAADTATLSGSSAVGMHQQHFRYQSARQQYQENIFSEVVGPTATVNAFSLTPVRSAASHRLMAAPPKRKRRISKVPFKVLDAPALQDDFYLNLVDWSSQNVLAVGLGSCVYLWSACTSKVTKLCDLAATNDTISSVSWAERGTHLAVGTNRGETQLWDTIKCRKVRTMAGHTARVGTLAWSGPVLASGSRDRLIFLRDVRIQASYTDMLCCHRHEVCGLKWSFDEPGFLASGGNDNHLLITDSRHPVQPLHKFCQHTAAVKAIAWSPHQHGLLASGGGTADRCIRFWNTLSGDCLNKVDTGSQVCNLAWSQNCNEIVSTHGYSQNQIVVWRYPSMNKVTTLTGHTMRVLYLAMSPDGSTVVTGAGDETLRFWQIFPGPRSDGKDRTGGGLLFPGTLGSVIR